MRVALCGPNGHARARSDLLERQPERVLQHDDARVVRRDLAQTAVQLAAQLRTVGLPRRIEVRRRATILEQRLAGTGTLSVGIAFGFVHIAYRQARAEAPVPQRHTLVEVVR